MSYAKSKGDEEPWAIYKTLTSNEQKRAFLSKYMKTKKFAWIRTLREEQSQRSSSSRTEEAGWLSKIQVADEEKLNLTLPEHQELLEAFLASLPSRPHKVKAWADMGMMEYNYTKAKETKGDTQEHFMKLDKEMKIDDKAHEALGNTLFKVAEPRPIPVSICDQVKEETEIAEDKALLEYGGLWEAEESETVHGGLVHGLLSPEGKARGGVRPETLSEAFA